MANCLTCKYFVECEQVFAYIDDDKACDFENEEENENAKECEIR